MKKLAKILTLAAAVLMLVMGCKKLPEFTGGNNNVNPTSSVDAPDGAINGLFTINSLGNQVYFSKGNLKYQASTNTWRFAENQWDYVGEGNANISTNYDGWIDLFGWGTVDNPTNSSTNNNDYGSPHDWAFNYLGSEWFVLSKDEFEYVFLSRSTSSGIRYAKAIVNNTNGIILLPDDWDISIYNLNYSNSHDASFSSNTITLSAWNSYFESHGAVFLPAAGSRSGTIVTRPGSEGGYWSATYSDSNSAYYLGYDGADFVVAFPHSRFYGHNVRLVCHAGN